MNEIEKEFYLKDQNNKTKSKKRYSESKKNLRQQITDLTIENQVIKKQLIAIRNMLNDIIGKTENEVDKEKK
ncbi:MAG: hypothetical protein mread185_000672 [Mycoplasmataceae bacterium]|nr:MAG: hypothetical protein mread185_000672 [Mycoplasmataceae bacterium]